MYAATANLWVARDKLMSFPIEHELLIQAELELTIAYDLMESRWKIWNSIFWKRSNAATQRSVRNQLEGLTFDARTSLLNAGKLCNQYFNLYGIADDNKELWVVIIHNLHRANNLIIKDYYYDSSFKQLKLELQI
jgi:hypothetical protein